MKTTLQQAIERIKEYRDMGSADADTCNAILLHLASLLPQEKEQMIDFAHKCRNVMAADEFAITHWYNKTYNP